MSIKIRIVSDFDKRGLTDAEKALDNLGKAAGVALAAVGAAVGAIAVKSVQEFAKFDAALTKSQAIMGDLSKTMETEMSNAAREVAKVTTFSAEQAAESFFFLASAGLDAESSIAALPRVAQFAQAGMFDMSRATDLLTDAQSALGLTIRNDAVANMENMIKVSDVLVRANTLSNATVEQFSTSLTTKAGAALRSFGIDMEEGVAVLAAFADQGIKGEEAGTQLSIVLRDLTTRAIKNKDEFEKFGVSVFDANGEVRNLGDIIANVETALSGMSDETKRATLLQLGFADRSVASLLALLGTSDAIKTYETELRSASGFTDEVANKQLDTFNSQLKLLESAFIDVGIQIGEQITPSLQKLIPVLQEILPIVGDKLAAAFAKVDWEGLATGVANFVVKIVENIDAIGKMVAALGTIAAMLVTYTTVTRVATAAALAFNGALALNLWGLAAAGLVAIAIGMNQVYNAAKKTTPEVQAVNREILKNENAFVTAATNGSSAYKGLIPTLTYTGERLDAITLATQGSRAEMQRFNNYKLGSIRNELALTANTAAALGAQLANNQRQLYYAMKGIDIEGSGIFNAPPPVIPETGGGPSAAEQARDQIQRIIKDGQKQLADAQKSYNETIKQANENYASSVERLQLEFSKRLEGIIQQSQDRLRNAYRSAVEVNLASLFTRDEERSVEGLVASLSERLAGSRNLLANSAQLASAGFSQTFIEQIVSAGVETGNELASAILNSTPEVQSELKALFSALEIESNQGMDALAEQIYERQGLATQALKDLYETTQIELADALLEQQAQLDQSLLDANNTFVETVQTIRDTIAEQVADKEGQLGGLGKTVDQFISKLDALIAKYRDLQNAAKISTFPEPSGGGGPIIETFPIPSAPPTAPRPTTSGPVINVNVKTDTTQSPAMVGQTIAKTIEKYTGTGGGIKGIKVVAI